MNGPQKDRYISLKKREFKFSPDQKSTIVIGRKKESDVVIDDENISRTQITYLSILPRFQFENGNWFIYDGSPNKTSRNGLWLLAKKSIKIEDGTVIKTGFTTFKASVLY